MHQALEYTNDVVNEKFVELIPYSRGETEALTLSAVTRQFPSPYQETSRPNLISHRDNQPKGIIFAYIYFILAS